MEEIKRMDNFLEKCIKAVLEETEEEFFLKETPLQNNGNEAEDEDIQLNKKAEEEYYKLAKGYKEPDYNSYYPTSGISQYQDAATNKPKYKISQEDKYRNDDMLSRKPQYQEAWTDKSVYKTPREDKSQYEDILGRKPHYQDAWTDKSVYKTSLEDKPQYDDMLGRKPQYQDAWADKSMYKTSQENKPRYDDMLGRKPQYQDEWNDKSVNKTSQEYKPRYDDMKGRKPQYQDEWNDKSVNKTSQEYKPRYDDMLGRKRQYRDEWNDKSVNNTSQENNPRYDDMLDRKPQYQDAWTDKSVNKTSQEDKLRYDEMLGRKPQYQDEWMDKPMYTTPRADKSQYEDILGSKSQYQDTWTNKSEYTTPGEGNSQYKCTEKSQYDSQMGRSSKYHNTSGNESQHSAGKYMSDYQPSRFEHKNPMEQSSQELAVKRERPHNKENIGYKYNFKPQGWVDDQEMQQRQQSFQERYDKFRSQRQFLKDREQSSKKQSDSKDSHKEFAGTKESNKSAEKFRDVNSKVAQPDTDKSHSTYNANKVKDLLDKEEEGIATTGEKNTDKKDTIQLIRRGMWGALPTNVSLLPLQPPLNTVVFSLNTRTSPCDTPKECMRRVREIQARHIGEGLGDIQYSFLLGGDGYVYEGRGLEFESGAKKEEGESANINIAYIGKYKKDSVPETMVTNTQKLVQYLHENGILKKPAIRMENKESQSQPQ